MAVAELRPGAGTRYRPIQRPALVWAFLDAMVLARRSVMATVRLPEVHVFTAIQPLMFVLLFRYVFGGAIQVPGGQYVNFLMPGIFVQTVAFGGVITGIGLAEDMHRGLIDRFRSLPMSSSAVVTGRTVADLARNLFTVVIMLLVGFLVGFRPGDEDQQAHQCDVGRKARIDHGQRVHGSLLRVQRAVVCRYRKTASGTKTARNATIQATD